MAREAQGAFFSYSREDSGFVLRLAKDLEAAGANAWLDQLELEAGQAWDVAIQDALTNSPVLLVILSPSSVNSRNVMEEVSFARKAQKAIIPVLIRACEIPYGLRSHQFVDFRNDYARGLLELLSMLKPEPFEPPQRYEIDASGGDGGACAPAPEYEADAHPAPAAPTPACARPKRPKPALKEKKLRRGFKAAKKKKAAAPVQLEEEAGLSISQPDYGTSSATVTIQNPSQVEVPRDLPVDNVHFTLTGPLVLAPGTAHELQFWLHVEQQRLAVLQAASELQGLPQSQLAVKSEGPYPLQRGSRISVQLTIGGLKCSDSHKWITWTGEIGNTTFVIEIPVGTSEGAYPGRASIRLDGCEIARMSFLVRVGAANPKVDEILSQTTSHRNAFASYASEDRAEVLSRVQGMEAAYKGLNVFVDVVNLRSGQNWEAELRARISKSDVFYLFWCCHAMKSEWVGKEWHWALAAKGQDFIDPVPLQRPELAPPPDELAAKHFNDPLLAFIAAAGGAHSE